MGKHKVNGWLLAGVIVFGLGTAGAVAYNFQGVRTWVDDARDDIADLVHTSEEVVASSEEVSEEVSSEISSEASSAAVHYVDVGNAVFNL